MFLSGRHRHKIHFFHSRTRLKRTICLNWFYRSNWFFLGFFLAFYKIFLPSFLLTFCPDTTVVCEESSKNIKLDCVELCCRVVFVVGAVLRSIKSTFYFCLFWHFKLLSYLHQVSFVLVYLKLPQKILPAMPVCFLFSSEWSGQQRSAYVILDSFLLSPSVDALFWNMMNNKFRRMTRDKKESPKPINHPEKKGMK